MATARGATARLTGGAALPVTAWAVSGPNTAAPPCPTSAALLAAVLADPADDLPRLALADHLDESGDDADKLRAEFIRVQCELAEGRVEVGSDCWPELRRRERELWNDYKHAGRLMGEKLVCCSWANAVDLPGADRTGQIGTFAIVRRGFVDEVRCSLATLFGGPCGRCEGSGGVPCQLQPSDDGWVPNPIQTCPACHGAGATPGIAETLWRSQPVTAVVCVGAEPLELAGGWRWSSDAHPNPLFSQRLFPRSVLPPDPFGRLAGYIPAPVRPPDYHRFYPSRPLALAALSAAACAAGRARAA